MRQRARLDLSPAPLLLFVQSSRARAVFALSLCREIVLRHGGTSTERKRENRELPAAVANSRLMTLFSRAGAARRWLTGLGRVESQDGVAKLPDVRGARIACLCVPPANDC
jgi:hypothetical protein